MPVNVILPTLLATAFEASNGGCSHTMSTFQRNCRGTGNVMPKTANEEICEVLNRATISSQPRSISSMREVLLN